MFQVRRCEDSSCCDRPGSEEIPGWLPYPTEDPNNAGHYKPFSQVYGQETTEDDIPSFKNDVRKVSAEQQGCPASTMTAQNVRGTATCGDCAKVRCVYSSVQLTDREHRELRSILRKYDYVCGCMITPDVSILAGKVFTRLEVTCTSPIEWAYYGATKIKVRNYICAHCGVQRTKVDQDLKKSFKTVLPMCEQCSNDGKQSLKRGPIHTPAAKRAAKQNKKKKLKSHAVALNNKKGRGGIMKNNKGH